MTVAAAAEQQSLSKQGGKTATGRLRAWLWVSLLLAVGWTGLCAFAAYRLMKLERDDAIEYARHEARGALERDLTFRRWNSQKGGVYVEQSPTNPPNRYLRVPDRELQTVQGKQLTMVNPAYMTRQAHELARTVSAYWGHITSLRPLNPDNAPDPWERAVLEGFARSPKEVSEVSTLNGAPYLRLMRPLVTEQSCLKCHAEQGYVLGDIRGGLSASVPLGSYLEDAERAARRVASQLTGLWVTGMLGIALAMGLLYRSSQRRGQLLVEQALMVERLGQAEKLEALGQLASAVAHDFNNLLTGILANLELMGDDLPEDSPLRTNLEEARLAADASREIVQRLLAYARPQSGQRRCIELATELPHIAAMLRRILGDRVEVSLTLAPGFIVVDPVLLQQILLNLAVNARDAMPQGGKLTLTSSPVTRLQSANLPAGDYIEILVSDEGEGIAPNVLGQVFEPFFTTKAAGQGTGLGLYTVRKAMRECRGDVTVTSPPGQGTTFQLLFPAAAPCATSRVESLDDAVL